MSDVNAIINIDINSSSALVNLKRLESQIDQFNRSVATSNATAAASQQGLNRALLDGINNTGLFNAKITPVESSMMRFSRSIDEGRLSLGEYTRSAASQLPGMSRVFKKEFDSIDQIARTRVKSMQTQYLALGKTVDGVTKAIASTPTGLTSGMATDLAMVQQRQQVFNKLLDDGSTKLLNWGKNTQWAGRQLMVGFTLPLAAFGAVASKTFMEIDKATISLKRVYGDLSTTKEELDSNVEAIKGLGKEYTKYGITLADTISLGGRAAATGATNEKLLAATEQTLRFATLGQMDYNQALDTTISLQTAFAVSNEDLGNTVDYLNAVENQTILTMEDMSLAIPRVATVVKGLGGSVQDLAVMMTAMREGGVSAENAANGLKSGLASLINPTDRASEGLNKMGINLNGIIKSNKGDLMGIITEFGTAINKLDGFSRQQVLEKVFGKFQYARMSALFTNITKDSGQAARAMDIAGMSAKELAAISEKELGQISESTSVKFQAAMEQLKISIAPIGEAFLKGITPIVSMVTKIADAFNNLPDGVKNSIAVITGLVAGLGPIFLMTIGLLGNGLANLLKGFQFIRKTIAGIRGDASAFTWLAQGELEAVTASKALEGTAVTLTDKLLLQKGAVFGLTAEYERFARAAGIARAEMGLVNGAPMPSGGGRAPIPTPRVRKNTGGTIPGVGSTDTVPAMLTPGEFVINKKSTAQNLPLLHAINNGQTMGGFNKGGQIPGVQYFGMRPGSQSLGGGRVLTQMTHTTPKPILTTTAENIPERILGSARGRVAARLAQSGVPVELLTDAWIRSPFNQKLKSSVQGVTVDDWLKNLQDSQLGPAYRRAGVEARALKEELIGAFLPSRDYTQEEFGNIIETAAKKIKPEFNPATDSAYLPKPEILRAYSGQLKEAGFRLEKNTENGKNYIVDITGKEKRQMASSSYPLTRNMGGLIPGGPVTKDRPFYGVATPRSKQLFEALTAWQTSSRSVRENPEMLGTLMSSMSPSRSRRTLTRGTTLGLNRGSEFNSVDELAIMDALKSGNVDSLIGREFDMRGPISYTAGGTENAINAMKQNADVNRIEFLRTQQAQAQKRHESNLKRIETLKTKIAKGTGPIDTYKAQLKELEGFVSMHPAGKSAMEAEIKGLASRGYQDLIIQQDFIPGSPLIDVNAVNPSGMFMGKDVSRESEFLSGGSRVRVKGVSVDEQTGVRRLELETIMSNIQKRNLGGPIFESQTKIVPGVGNTDTVPAMLTPGEFVINKQATQSNLPLLHAINNGQTARKNRGGIINGTQYLADGGGVQSTRGSASGSGAYKKETQRIMDVGWDSLQTEKEILKAMRDNNEITEGQLKAFSQGETSHITPEVGPSGGKMWRPSNMMADLGLINNYIEAQKGTSRAALTNAQMFDEIQRKTNLSGDKLRIELDALSKGFHATTAESARVLKALSEIGPQTGQKKAVSRVLDARLQGTYYDTLGAPERQYNPNLPTEEKMGKGSSGGRSIPEPKTSMRPKVSPEESDRIRKQARAEAERSLISERGMPFTQSGQYEQEVEKRAKELRTKEYKRINEKHGREQARLIAISRQSQSQQVNPVIDQEDLSALSPEEGGRPRNTRMRSKIGGGLMKGGGAVGMMSMLPFMMQDQEGKFMGMDANMLGMGMMGAGMAMPAIGSAIGAGGGAAGGAGMLAGGGALAAAAPVLLPVAIAAAAVGAGLILWRKNIDENSKETANLTANLGVTANSVEAMGKILNVQSPSQRRQQIQLGFTANQNQIAQQVVPALQTEEGQKLIEELRVANSEDRYKKLGDYIKSAVATGMMTKKEATVFGKVAAATIGDAALGSRVTFAANMQEKGSSGMMGIARERMAALSTNELAKQGMASTGEVKGISPAAAAAVVGSSIQIVSDLADVIQLAREEYQDGTISVKEYRDVINEAKDAQSKYNDYIINAVSGSQEQGGTRQAVRDQLIASGKATAEQLDMISGGMNIGSTSLLGLDSAQTTAGIAKIMNDQGDPLNQRNWLQSVPAGALQFLSSKGMTTDEKMSMPDNFLGSLGSFFLGGVSDLDIETQRKVDKARPIAEQGDILYNQAEKQQLEEKYLNALNKGEVTADQIQQFNEFLKSGTADAVAALKDINKNNDIVGAMYASSSRQAGMSESVIEVGLKFKQEGGDLAEYQNFINSLPKDKQIEYAITFTGLNANERVRELKDIETMSARIGKENASMFGGSKFYTTAIKNNETQPLLKQTRKAEKAGVGESYGTIVAGIVTNDNGKQITVSEFLSLSESTIKALKKWSEADTTAKKSVFLSLQTSFEGPDGKRISAQEASAIYDELIGKFGKGRITRLPDDVISKVVVLNMQIEGLKEAEKALLASEVLANAMTGDIPTGPQKAELSRLAAIRVALNNAKAVRASLISSADLTPRGGGGGGGDGKGGGAKDNPLLNFRNGLLEQIRLYSDIEATLKTLFSKQTSVLGILAKKNGMDDKLRAAGVGEPMVQSLLSMGSAAAKKWYKQNVSGGKVTEKGKTDEKVMLGAAMINQESQAVGAIRNAETQQQASRFISSGKFGKATAETRTSILGDPTQAKGFVEAAKEYNILEKKRMSFTMSGETVPTALKKKWKEAKDFALSYIDTQNKAYKASNLVNQVELARTAISNQAIKIQAKSLLATKNISQAAKDAILSSAETTNAYLEAQRIIDKGERAPKGKKGNKDRKAAAQARIDQGILEQGVVPDAEMARLEDNLDLANKAKEKSDKIYKDQMDPILEQIRLIDRQIEKIQELNNNDQNRIRDLSREKELLERQVEVINRKNEKDQLSIDKLQREDELRTRISDSLNHELSIMSEQETKIRDAYDKRITALDEVAKINDYIIGQQRSQLGLAQALSQGDVYAAAAAQQEMQAGSVQFATGQTRAGLEVGMENQIEGLTTSGGLTRVQAEDQIRAIGEQTYQNSLLVRDLQDNIYSRNLDIAAIKIQQRDVDDSILLIQDDIYKRETEIIGIQLQKLTPLQKQLTLIQDQKIGTDKVAEAEIDAAQVELDTYTIGKLRVKQVNDLANAWIRVATIIAKTNEIFKSKSSVLGAMPEPAAETATEAEKKTAQENIEKWKKRYSELKVERDTAQAAAKEDAAKIYTNAAMATGGVVGAGGRDSVAAMLTPGEYVMRKASVQKYGKPMLERMNMGAFDMPRYNVQEAGVVTPITTTSTNTSITAPVYNTYSVNVSANTNASADDIANTVMTKIKNVGNSSIRRISGY